MAVICEAALAQVKAQHPGRVFGLRTSGDLGGRFDSARLQPLFAQLLDNAVRHGAQDVPVVLEARGWPDAVSVLLRDLPLPGDALRMMFHPPVPAAPGGADFLAALDIVLALGGTLTVEASSPSGATITVRFPRHA